MKKEVIISKLANALQPKAEAVDGFGFPINFVTERHKKKHGGLWVGGRMFVTEKEIVFSQNAMNKILHKTNNDLTIPLSTVKSVERIFGFLTGIIVIKTEKTEYKLRCYGAKKVASRINEIMHS